MPFRTPTTFLAASVWLVLSLTGTVSAQTDTPTDRPNIIFILADDMGYGDPPSFNENSQIPTPNIDRLAEEGMRFTDAHSPGALCMPTRYGLMTGRNPIRIDWHEWDERALIQPDRTTIASLLQNGGYATGMIGKWHLGFDGGIEFDCSEPLRGGPVDHGFEYFFGMHASLDIPPYFYIRNDECVAAPTDRIGDNFSADEFWTDIQGAFWRAGKMAPGFNHDDVLPRFREEAVGYLEDRARSGDRPFFLYLALTAPHTPWLPDREFQGTSDAGLYGDFTVQVDDLLGKVLDTLDRLGMSENTLVVFTSDNGPVWYEKDEERFGHHSTGPYRGMKGDIWEGGHRVPFVVRWPGQTPAGGLSDETITFTDMLATFGAIVNHDIPESTDSYNLLPVLTGQSYDSPIREVTVHGGSGYRAIRQGKWKLIPGLGSGGFSDPRTREPGPDEPAGQLYNLEADPGETNNLYDIHPEIVERLSNTLQAYTR